jgi:hypothetical protein
MIDLNRDFVFNLFSKEMRKLLELVTRILNIEQQKELTIKNQKCLNLS